MAIRITDSTVAASNNRDHGKLLRVKAKRTRDAKYDTKKDGK